MSEDILKKLEDAIVGIQVDGAGAAMQTAMEAGIPGVEILNHGLVPALNRVGVLFRDGDYFLPDVLMCVNIYNQAFRLIEPELKAGNYEPKGKVMLGTVKGDTHDIGKNILSALLQGNGYQVINLGMNVPAETFLAKAKETEPHVIGMSALLTTTMPEMKATIDLFGKAGIRDKYRFIVGGAPVTQDFADRIGADGYGEEAQAGVELVKRLIA
jgi:5-methyltetrahydrofolate--homocysteine methyltransferase